MGIQEKSENFNSLNPILFDFELCKKKTTGGVKLPPPLPPTGIGLRKNSVKSTSASIQMVKALLKPIQAYTYILSYTQECA